jgi:NAD(P)-dependent dehydrogenase (short-subunit alcohol dehydrogenase family)
MKKVALITGANKGLGLETARQLGDLGYSVLVGSRDVSRGETAVSDLKSAGIDAHFVHLDMENSATFDSAVAFVENNFGHLDALVNNAGIFIDSGIKAQDVPVEDIKKTFEVNFFSVIELTQKFIPLLTKSPAGRIVNLSSILGSLKLNADPKSPFGEWRSLGYNSSKTALNAFSAILSFHLRETNIKVNSAHPGWVKTDLGGSEAPMDIVNGAKTSVWLATLPEDGPTGGYFHMKDSLPW